MSYWYNPQVAAAVELECDWYHAALTAAREAGRHRIVVKKIPGHPYGYWGWICTECYGTPAWQRGSTGAGRTHRGAWAAAENHWHRHLGRGPL